MPPSQQRNLVIGGDLVTSGPPLMIRGRRETTILFPKEHHSTAFFVLISEALIPPLALYSGD